MIFVFLWLTSLSMIISRSIHVAANGIISFFFYGWVLFNCIYIHTHTHHIFFIHSYVSGHLGCFYVLAFVNSAAANCVNMCIFQYLFLILWDIYLEVELQDHMIFLYLTICGIIKLFSIVAYHFTFPPALYRCSNFSTSLSTIVHELVLIIAILVDFK